MGKYLSPSLQQVEEAELKCAVIWYYSDSGLFFQQAVRGALADLRFPYKWEGDDGLVREIAGKFTETDLMTDDTFFVKDCDILSEALDKDGTMAINVTVNSDCGGDCGCGCGGSGVGGDAKNTTDFVVPKMPINPPTDDFVSVPDGFETREDYDEYKCAYATRLVRDFIETVTNFQVISGLTTLGSAWLTTWLITGGSYEVIAVGLAAAGLSVTGGVVLLGVGLAALVGFGAIAYDYFNDIADYMTANEEEFICGVYGAATIDDARQVFADNLGDAITNLALTDGVGDALQNLVNNIVDALVPGEILVGLLEFVKDLTESEFDCSSCGSSVGTAVFDFLLDNDDWNLGIGRATYVPEAEAIRLSPKQSTSPHPVVMRVQLPDILDRAGLNPGTDVKFTSLDLSVLETNGTYWADGKTVVVVFKFDGGTTQTSLPITSNGAHDVPIPSDAQVQDSSGGGFAMEIHGLDSTGSESNSQVYIEDVAIGVQAI